MHTPALAAECIREWAAADTLGQAEDYTQVRMAACTLALVVVCTLDQGVVCTLDQVAGYTAGRAVACTVVQIQNLTEAIFRHGKYLLKNSERGAMTALRT
ncbi:hypothetical protein ACO0LF_25160 [Undibacterium sp. Di27W]|uniref:hypothetical protein n=1 Tax=Undibacterium sp. Di27W TaxID=3413036 RepID=UPI003BF35F07